MTARAAGRKASREQGRSSFRRSRLALLAALLAAPGLPAGGTEPGPTGAREVLEGLRRGIRELTTLQARLVQVRSYPRLGLVDPPEDGSLWLARLRPPGAAEGSKVRALVRMERPEAVVLRVDGPEYIYYQPRIKQAFVGRLDGTRGGGPASFLGLLAGDPARLAESHVAELVGREEVAGRSAYRLRLRPRPEGGEGHSRLELWVDARLWLPLVQETETADGSVTRVELKDPVVGGRLGEDAFRLELPPGTERVRG